MKRVWAYKQLDLCKCVSVDLVSKIAFLDVLDVLFFMRYEYETPSVPSFWPIWKPGFCRTYETNIIGQVLNVNFDNLDYGFHNIPLISKFRLGSFRHQIRVWCYFHWEMSFFFLINPLFCALDHQKTKLNQCNVENSLLVVFDHVISQSSPVPI